MAASNPSMSICKLSSGSHLFKIIGYSESKGIGIGKYIMSETFKIGGYNWGIRYYPDGYEKEDRGEFISFFIELMDTDDFVKALFDIRLVDESGKTSDNTPEVVRPHLFKASSDTWGFYQFIRKEELESSEFLEKDIFTVKCNLVVVKDSNEEDEKVDDASVNLPD
ncbi:hypothetical protein LUZ60_002590 [Juncus effusus]|nr:hypothetical protein LUZ60_002590 [Juncus effusus]